MIEYQVEATRTSSLDKLRERLDRIHKADDERPATIDARPGIVYADVVRVLDAAMLRKAQANPDEHRNLIVRVAGYSDYFVDLGSTLQDEIISRTEHQLT